MQCPPTESLNFQLVTKLVQANLLDLLKRWLLLCAFWTEQLLKRFEILACNVHFLVLALKTLVKEKSLHQRSNGGCDWGQSFLVWCVSIEVGLLVCCPSSLQPSLTFPPPNTLGRVKHCPTFWDPLKGPKIMYSYSILWRNIFTLPLLSKGVATFYSVASSDRSGFL